MTVEILCGSRRGRGRRHGEVLGVMVKPDIAEDGASNTWAFSALALHAKP
jgi:hypothetical protein